MAMAFSRRPAALPRRKHLRGLPVLVHEVSRRVWGLRLRRTDRGLALSLTVILPSASPMTVGILIGCFRSSIPSPPIPCLCFTTRLAAPSAKLGAEQEAAPSATQNGRGGENSSL